MTKNVTLRIDEDLLRQARKRAVDEDTSLSQWLTSLIRERIQQSSEIASARKRAIRRLQRGFSLKNQPLTRDETHARR